MSLTLGSAQWNIQQQWSRLVKWGPIQRLAGLKGLMLQLRRLVPGRFSECPECLAWSFSHCQYEIYRGQGGGHDFIGMHSDKNHSARLLRKRQSSGLPQGRQ